MTLSPGLFYLLASVVCSVAVAAMLKLARRWQVDVRQAIMVNHAVAALLCWTVLRPDPATLLTPQTPWLVLVALGLLWFGVQRAIALAFAALFCLLRRPAALPAAQAPETDAAARRALWLWPLAVWVTYGVVDILFKQVARAGTAFASGLLLAFALASALMLLYLLWRRAAWAPRHLAAGVALGVVNFGNILTYIRAHQALPEHPALVFASMNMGVITLGTLVGALVFREPLTRLNGAGLALALGAILLMTPW